MNAHSMYGTTRRHVYRTIARKFGGGRLGESTLFEHLAKESFAN